MIEGRDPCMERRSGASDMNSELAVNGSMDKRLIKKDDYMKECNK
jgi:hypothetical protein